MNLISEVRRRNVHRMAVLYVLTSWLIMQAAEVVMTLAALPDWVGRLTLALLALGFPIALLFSWFFELTPEGLSLEKNVKREESITDITGRRLDFVVIALLCAAVLIFAYDKWWMSGPPVSSIAVLPLEDIGVDTDQQYLAEGMTEVLTAELGQIDSLRVISRSSAMRYKGSEKRLPEIAKELGVDAVVEGSIQPVGDEVRFTMQLIDGRSDRHLWARSYHRDLRDILTLQGEIAQAIADEIKIALTPEVEARLARERTTNSEALRLWAVGVHHLTNYDDESFQKALQVFTEASSLDPDFANAYAGIAHTYLLLGSWHGSQNPRIVFPLARLATDKALALDPNLPEARFALAKIFWNDWQWEAAESEFRRAMELNPSIGFWLLEYSNFLTSMGRADEAVEIARRAVTLDPLSPAAYNELAYALGEQGMVEEALEQFRRSLQLDPDFHQTHSLLAFGYSDLGEQEKALEHLEQWAEDLESQSLTSIGYIGGFYADLGRPDEARRILELLVERNETEYVPAMALALIYLGLEEYGEAVPWLEKAYDERDLSLVWYRDESAFPEEIRDDPRVQAVIAGITSLSE